MSRFGKGNLGEGNRPNKGVRFRVAYRIAVIGRAGAYMLQPARLIEGDGGGVGGGDFQRKALAFLRFSEGEGLLHQRAGGAVAAVGGGDVEGEDIGLHGGHGLQQQVAANLLMFIFRQQQVVVGLGQQGGGLGEGEDGVVPDFR